jgi:hypothetical protein
LELKALRLLGEGNQPVDIMSSLELDVPAMQKLLTDYAALQMHKKERVGADLFVMLAKYFGEDYRDGYDYYVDETGTFYYSHDVYETMRKENPSLVRSSGDKTHNS